MKITVLTTDHSRPETGLLTEHGLSIYVEHEGFSYLIDTGQSSVFLENARALQLNMDEIDFVIITHGHYDHINGLPHFLKINSKAKVIISSSALNQQFFSDRNGTKVFIGKNFNLNPADHNRLIDPKDNFPLPFSLTILTDKIKKYPLPESNRKLFKKIDRNCIHSDTASPPFREEKEFIPDDFDYEIIPCLIANGSIIVFTGCAHQGILNIMVKVHEQFPGKMIETVVGGYHLKDEITGDRMEYQEELDFIAETLIKYFPETNFYTGHCTGPVSFDRLKKTLGKRIQYFYPGFTIMRD